MLNVYETIRSGLHYNKFEVGDLLFVEYACPIEEDKLDVWTPCDYMLHVLTGKKGWRTSNHHWTAKAGETFYVKKGAFTIEQFFEEEFCMLLFFITDDFIRDSIKQLSARPATPLKHLADNSPVIEVNNDITLNAYFQSMLSYFSKREKPSDELLILKLRELLLNVLQTQANPQLASYFYSLQNDSRPSLKGIMQDNFLFNLSIEEYASMCGRSISSFKREFKKLFRMSPGSWLRKRRLEYATSLLASSDLNISEICLQCGFENPAHFSRIFKEELNITPSAYRKQLYQS